MYQVLARKWRPQRFEEVVGQRGVTQTLRNAIVSGRTAQAFVFAGARGVGKTTTARILARALNCERGPTPDPCGVCPMCVEIAEGRDLDVLEIDAATHTGVDNVRDVIIDGLAIRPVRARYKIFIIDEVHQLSGSSFNALLKSMEEPPPHVIFMMATTELHKIPDTILSRAQVFELRTIGLRAIVEQLAKIAKAEGVEVSDEALTLIARAAEGSMRDGQSALDQVLAFGGSTIDARQVSEVLGLVGRDLLLDVLDVVASEDAPRVFDVAARIVESGHELRHVCRELARVVRDLMVLQIDPGRTSDPEFALEGDVDRLSALARAFSREDLLRAFDLIAKLETDLRTATQPRYHLEMALLRWVHLRRLVPLASLIDALERGTPLPRAAAPAASKRQPDGGTQKEGGISVPPERLREVGTSVRPKAPAAAVTVPKEAGTSVPPAESRSSAFASADQPPAQSGPALTGSEESIAQFREAFLAEIKRTRPKYVYNTVFAPARRVDVTTDSVLFVFGSRANVLVTQFEQQRPSLVELATKLAGRPIKVVGRDEPVTESRPARGDSVQADADSARLKAEAMNEPAVQALLDVFPAEITNVREIKE